MRTGLHFFLEIVFLHVDPTSLLQRRTFTTPHFNRAQWWCYSHVWLYL